MAKRKKLLVQGRELTIYTEESDDFISLSDIAKDFGEPRITIQNWIRTRNAIEFLAYWEMVHNNDFKRIEFEAFLFEAGGNAFSLSPSHWVETTNAKGMIVKRGRSGGTFAHPDIAITFCHWLSPKFQVYLAKEFQRLKELEAEQREDQFRFDVRRELTKINWHRHQQAVKLLPPRKLDIMGERYIYANEADLLNLALFGMTAKKWQDQNPEKKGNMRDHASIEQLTVLANLENINALLIENGLTQDERLQILNDEAIKQMDSLLQYDRARGLKSMEEE